MNSGFCKTVLRRYKPSLTFCDGRWLLVFFERTKYRSFDHCFTFSNEPYDKVVKKANRVIIDWQTKRWAETKEKADAFRERLYKSPWRNSPWGIGY